MEPDFLVEQLDSLQDLDNLEESIVQDKEIKNKLVSIDFLSFSDRDMVVSFTISIHTVYMYLKNQVYLFPYNVPARHLFTHLTSCPI